MVYILFIILVAGVLPAYAGETGDLPDVNDLIKKGKLAEASTLLRKEIDAHPENVEAYRLLGRVYLIEGDEVKASSVFDKVISIDKGFEDKVSSEYYGAGLILIKDPKKSNIGLHFINKYIREKGDKGQEAASSLYAAGVDMLGANRFMAHVILDRTLVLNPSYEKDEDFYLSYSVKSIQKSADLVEGGKDFLTKFPGGRHVPEVLYLMGEAYSELRNHQEARTYFQRLIKEFPETEWGKKAVTDLKF